MLVEMEGIGPQGYSLGQFLLQFLFAVILRQKQQTATCWSCGELSLVCMEGGDTRAHIGTQKKCNARMYQWFVLAGRAAEVDE